MIQPLHIPTIIRQRVRAFYVRAGLRPQKLTSFEVGQQLFNLGLKYRLLDNSYLTVSKEDWEKVIASDWIDRKRWAKDKFDCDEFARSFWVHAYEYYGLSGCGLVMTPRHVFNWVIFNDGTWSFFEPQSDDWVDSNGLHDLTDGEVII